MAPGRQCVRGTLVRPKTLPNQCFWIRTLYKKNMLCFLDFLPRAQWMLIILIGVRHARAHVVHGVCAIPQIMKFIPRPPPKSWNYEFHLGISHSYMLMAGKMLAQASLRCPKTLLPTSPAPPLIACELKKTSQWDLQHPTSPHWWRNAASHSLVDVACILFSAISSGSWKAMCEGDPCQTKKHCQINAFE